MENLKLDFTPVLAKLEREGAELRRSEKRSNLRTQIYLWLIIIVILVGIFA